MLFEHPVEDGLRLGQHRSHDGRQGQGFHVIRSRLEKRRLARRRRMIQQCDDACDGIAAQVVALA